MEVKTGKLINIKVSSLTTGKPIQGAIITIFDTNGEINEAITDANGNCDFICNLYSIFVIEKRGYELEYGKVVDNMDFEFKLSPITYPKTSDIINLIMKLFRLRRKNEY